MKDLIYLLTFRDNKILALVMWALVITVIVFAVKGLISHRQLSHVAPVKTPIFYQYEVITYTDTSNFGTQTKLFLSERNNAINVDGLIYSENVRSIKLVQTIY